jgi:hypothetical protein
LFRSSSEILANYRRLLGAKRTVTSELAQITSADNKATPKTKGKPAEESK